MSPEQETAPDLFDEPMRDRSTNAPLAERMRPHSFDDLTGQDEIVGKGRPLPERDRRRPSLLRDSVGTSRLWQDHPGPSHFPLNKSAFRVVLGRHERSV